MRHHLSPGRTLPWLLLPVLLVCTLGLSSGVPRAYTDIRSPEAFFGFRMGADGQLAAWDDIQRYFGEIAQASNRVHLIDIGPTTAGRRMIGAIVSAPENIARLEDIRAVNRRLSDPRTIAGEEEARRLAADHRVVVAIGCSIHAQEVGATQMANELLHELATGTDARTLSILRDVIVILFPSLNPDGHVLVVDWLNRHRNTPYEASPMPWMSHSYAGHDLNRDAFMLNMVENRNLARFFHREWHPQVFLSLHQMGQRGPRFFVPPTYDPVNENYDPLIWRQAGLLGHAMALELERENRSGVVSNALFDYYSPGYEDSAPLGRNTICLLAEAASARGALPITVRANELVGSPRGLPEYRPQVNFPNPWPGGVWRLRDIVEYELIAARGLLDAASRYRDGLAFNFYLMGRRAIEAGRMGEPSAFLIPPGQHDRLASARLANLLIDAGVEVHASLEPFEADGQQYQEGTLVILLAQPFRAYVKTLLEPQRYPVRRAGRDGHAEPPYDAAGWTLPWQMGVSVVTVRAPFHTPAMARQVEVAVEPAHVQGEARPGHYLVDASGNAGTIAANRLLAAGLEPAWITKPEEAGGYLYPAGSLAVRHTRQSRRVIAQLAVSLGARATGVKGHVPAAHLPIRAARIGLYRPWMDNSDEGWTRWLLERHEFDAGTVTDEIVRRGQLRAGYDVIVLPDAAPNRLVAGHRDGTVPPEYSGGLGQSGLASLKAFVEEGGTLVTLNGSGALAIDLLDLPLADATREAEGFFCPGSILRLQMDASHPLAFGMVEETAAFFSDSSAYRITSPQPGLRVPARYGDQPLLLSGWLERGETIAAHPAVVEAQVGRGRAVLIGFRAQHRGQTHATFRLLFNAIHSHQRAGTAG
jgi:hypothetical protein